MILAIRVRPDYLPAEGMKEQHMADTAFNTIAEVQRLRDAGFEQAQAEAITLSIHAGVTGGVATRADLERTEQNLKTETDLVRKDIESTEQRLDARIDLVRSDLEHTEQRLDARIGGAEQRLDAKIESTEQRLESRIDTVASTLRTEIADVRTEIATVKVDLTWRLLAGIAVLNGFMVAVLRFLPAG